MQQRCQQVGQLPGFQQLGQPIGGQWGSQSGAAVSDEIVNDDVAEHDRGGQ